MVKSTPQKTHIIQHDYLIENPEWKCQEKSNYKIYQSGSHSKGNFIQLYVPNNPYRDEKGKTKAVMYLHGFALCMPKFYEQHLEELVQKGYYVFFPGFQKSEYPDDPETDGNKPEDNEKNLVDWSALKDFIKNTYKNISKGRVISFLRRITVAAIRLRFFLAIFVIIGLVYTIYSFIDHRYGRNLIKLIRTVRYSLFDSPSQWINSAMISSELAWNMLCSNNRELEIEEPDVYLFGHSLGGLLALSWVSYLPKDKPEVKSKFYPKQIIVADPAPNTSLGIPKTAMLVLKAFNSPFITGEIDIKKTGLNIDVPVAILHGDNDKLVPAKVWSKPSFITKKSNFDYIASLNKQIYFSLSNKIDYLFAFHNQAVTDTTYFEDNLFKKFGGVKHQPNAYNYEYIWSGLNLVIEKEVKASELLDKFPLKTIKVVDKLPEKAMSIKPIMITILAMIALYGLGYFIWKQAII